MDLAEQIDDFIPSIQSSNSEMDSLIMLLFILLIVSLFLLWLGRFLYQKYVTNKAVPSTSSTSTTSSAVNATSSNVTPATSSLLAQKMGASLLTSSLGGAKSGGGGGSSSVGNTPVRRGSGGHLPAASPALQKTRSMSQQPNAGVRKRLTRRSPGPELPNQHRRSRSIPPPASVTGPDDTTSTWASQVFKWLYSDLVIVNDLLYGFITAINQTMARNTSEEKMLIEVVRLLPESTPPNISNIFCDKPMTSDSVSEVVVTMDVETTLVLQVKAFRQVSGKADVLHYRVSIRFRGHLSLAMNYTALVGEMRIEGYPDIKITIASIGPIKTNSKEEKEIQDMICESLNLTIRDTLYPVDFSVHATCPRAMKMEPDEYYDHHSMEFPNPYDYMGGGGGGQMQMQNRMPYDQSSMREMNQSPVHMTSSRRLLVKIVKGDGLAQAKDPYCVVEMDEPPQKNQTGSRQGSSPFWDEHFLFDLSHASSEILFEVYDRPNSPNEYPKFLGLGLVGVDELTVGPSSSQVIGLQPRPYETQTVNGALTVEFVFIEGAQVPAGRRPYKLKEALKLDPHQQEQQMYGYDQPPISPARLSPMLQRQQQQSQINGNGSGYMNENPNLSRTTSPSHDINSLRPINYSSPQRHSNISVPNSSKQYPYDNSNSQSQSPNLLSPSSINNKMPVTSTPNKPNSLNVKISMIQQQQNENYKEPSIEPISGNLSERGRERKKTTIFGTLRKRLSRSKTRNEDLTNGNANTNNTTNGYSESHHQLQPSTTYAPKHQYSNSFDSTKTNPSLTSSQSKNLTSPTGTLNRFGISGSSRRSSMSEMSGVSRLSSISNKTFLHESSSLVLEVLENGVRRHYLVPMNVAQKPRWRRKGTKLHIYNDHTFVAKHLPSGLICEICMVSIPFRMGKQGYECRDCLLKCHKQCHVRTPGLCPKPTIQSIELCKIKFDDTAIRKL